MLQAPTRAADRRRRRHHQRRRVRPAGRAGRDPRRAGHPDPDGLGRHPGRPPADGRHGRAADRAPLRQRDDARVGLRARHRQPVGQPAHRRPRHLPRAAARSSTSTSSRPRSGGCSRPTTGSSPTPRPRWSCSSRSPRSAAGAAAPTARRWVDECVKRKQTMQRRTHFDDVPIKPQRVYEEMNRAFGRDTRYVSTIGLSQIAGAQFLHVYKPRHWINCGQAGPLGWTMPAALGVCVADPDATVVALSGDYDFQFMIEELAVGAQFNLPYLHVVVNNSYLGLIRQSAARLRHGLLRPAVVRQRQLPRARRLRRRPRQGGRGPGLQGDPGHRAGRPAGGLRAGEQADGRVPGAGGRRGASWSGSPTSRWAPSSTTSPSSRSSPSAASTPRPRSCADSTETESESDARR